ncbi:hypothetical protein [Hahella sp. HN01]|uniref:hypothetical protein n=1 Tax=Hahella sp. HN01 TaxID=2847262 RepID=UPI001C1EF48C|nr:hypothetical protein [Hahella sp. HN01]MBU6952596.1 hypothetical protein [Hahella sp. HN01]
MSEILSVPRLKRRNENVPGLFLIGKITNPEDPERDILFYKYGSMLVIFIGSIWKNKKTGAERYISYQACFPMAALTWVCKALSHFMTPPKDGGLAPGRIAVEDEVGGEN